ncbi:hypothetical protein ASG49_13745 [Marmoricola sp. Leaf446]|uniref:hypothetical protein n=1 Tax=Marmoricola sp. Leaf446 TaxID=1736379 RepID=UPI0006FAD28D|nr:hypothetical protein [Marmoricola sp. Leaf446]KQT90800.1 hypothetical protein ASG49_13745 [Marmoricola sp. Leaf446]
MTGTSSPLIDPRIDVYGKDGRTGALADLIEFRAIKGHGMAVADLVDLISNMGWTSKPTRQIITGHPEDENPDSLAEQTFSLLDERREVLGDRYPFRIAFGQLRVKDGFELAASPYIAMLAITIAHAWDVDCGAVKPEAALEALVEAALQTRMPSAGLGTADRNGTSFVDNLRAGAARVGLTASPNPVPRRVRAKDGGVDTLAGHVWADRRAGHWVFIGQVTCGQTSTWSGKLNEPKPALWKDYLQELLPPLRFLAVPHHVDSGFFHMLQKQDEGLVIDRLRLVLVLDTVVGSVAPIIDAVLASAS